MLIHFLLFPFVCVCLCASVSVYECEGIKLRYVDFNL